eukprot:Skav230460  [mRNA]  locus=scaffold186:112906:116152:- [translate_table: standard]
MVSAHTILGSKVQCVRWWMALYGSPTAKRHYAFGNTAMILGLDRGVLRKSKNTSEKKKVVTAQKYIDKSGKKRYKGTSQLRATEHYPMPFARAVVDQIEAMKMSRKGCPQLPTKLPSAFETFTQMEWHKSDATPEELAATEILSPGSAVVSPTSEQFLNKLEITIKKKQKIQLTKEEGWYSDAELEELGWTRPGDMDHQHILAPCNSMS